MKIILINFYFGTHLQEEEKRTLKHIKIQKKN